MGGLLVRHELLGVSGVAPTGLGVCLWLIHRAYALGYACFAPSGLAVSCSRVAAAL